VPLADGSADNGLLCCQIVFHHLAASIDTILFLLSNTFRNLLKLAAGTPPSPSKRSISCVLDLFVAQRTDATGKILHLQQQNDAFGCKYNPWKLLRRH